MLGDRTVSIRRGGPSGGAVALVALVVFAAVAPALAAGGTALGEDLRTLTYGESATSYLGSADPTTTDPLEQGRDGTWYYEPVTFDGEAGDRVHIEMSTGVNAVLQLVNPDGDVVAVNDNCDGDTLDACITQELGATGEYEIRATFYKPENTHLYTLSLDRVEGESDSPEPATAPRFEVVDASVNTSSVYAGDAVRVTATVRNEGTAAGEYAGVLTANDRNFGTERVTLDAGETRNLTFEPTLHNLGQARLFLRTDHLLDVQVRQRPDTAQLNAMTTNRTTHADVRFADGPVTVPLSVPDGDGVRFEALRLTGTPAAFDLTVSGVEMDGMAETLPRGVDPVGALAVEGAPTASNLRLTLAANPGLPADRLTVYRTENGTNWTAHEPTVLASDANGTRLQVRTADASTFVVGVRNPVFETGTPSLSVTSLTAGESVTVTTTVSNVGAAAGSHTVALTVDGAVVAERTVDLAAGTNATVELTATPEVGTHTLAVNGTEAGEVSVAAAQADTPTETPPDTATASEPSDPSDGEPGTTPGAGPGFGAATALLALVALAVLVGRRG